MDIQGENYFLKLHDDLIVQIFSFLDDETKKICKAVEKRWNILLSVEEAAITRIDDRKFLIKHPRFEKPLIVNIPHKYTLQQARQIVHLAKRALIENLSGFEWGNKFWNIHPIAPFPYPLFLDRIINLFFRTLMDTHADYFHIDDSWSTWIRRLEYEEELTPNFTLPINTLQSEESFADPFTKLAIRAYQEVLETFVAKDAETDTPWDCPWVYVRRGDNLCLILRNELTNEDFLNNEGLINDYYQWLCKEYGLEKVMLVEYQYNFRIRELLNSDFLLTPEYIYRMNIGVNDINISDIQNLLDKLLNGREDELTRREKRGIQSLPKSQWLHDLNKEFKVIDLEPEAFNALIQVYHLDQAAYRRSLTGREVHGFIRSYYTNAERTTYKPWIDQQELFQTNRKLLSSRDWEYYIEKLVHVVVKKNLVRPHFDGQWRVGGLIPAPIGKEGTKRWYRITSCVSNGSGIFSYTLESACHDLTLPVVKFWRSTTSFDPDLRSKASWNNDVNPIRSPGYEGMGLGDRFELEFVRKYTMPVWVAYLELAKRKLKKNTSNREVFLALKKATNAYDEENTRQHRPKTLKEIILEHDATLNRLWREQPWNGKFKNYSIVLQYIRNPEVSDEKNLASSLKEELKRFYDQGDNPRLKFVIDDIDQYVLNFDEERRKRSLSEARLDYQMLMNYPEIYQQSKNQKALLEVWSDFLQERAKILGEDPSSKPGRNIILAGHSLGGACAQSHLVRYFIHHNRVPLPGYSCEGWFFHDPAIEKGDNNDFKDWGFNHLEMLNELKITFAIKRREEVGDFVPLGGEEHLGACFSMEEKFDLLKWVQFDSRVREKLKTAKDPTIAESSVVHGTQFCEGIAGIDYKETIIDPIDQGIFDKMGKIKPKRWAELRQIWDFPTAATLVDGKRLRASRLVSMIVSMMRRCTDYRLEEFVDENGVFAVTEEGVVSKK